MEKAFILHPVLKKSLAFLGLSALSVALPFVMHLAGLNGMIFLPIYFAVIIAALFLDPVTAVLVGLSTPFLNYLVTGMPAFAPVPMLPMLVLELTVLSLLLWFLKSKNVPVMIALITSVIAARIVSVVFVPFFEPLTLQLWLNFRLMGLPGTILNSVLGFGVFQLINKWKK